MRLNDDGGELNADATGTRVYLRALASFLPDRIFVRRPDELYPAGAEAVTYWTEAEIVDWSERFEALRPADGGRWRATYRFGDDPPFDLFCRLREDSGGELRVEWEARWEGTSASGVITERGPGTELPALRA